MRQRRLFQLHLIRTPRPLQAIVEESETADPKGIVYGVRLTCGHWKFYRDWLGQRPPKSRAYCPWCIKPPPPRRRRIRR